MSRTICPPHDRSNYRSVISNKRGELDKNAKLTLNKRGELDKNAKLTLSKPENASLGQHAAATLTIVGGDVPTVQFKAAQYNVNVGIRAENRRATPRTAPPFHRWRLSSGVGPSLALMCCFPCSEFCLLDSEA